MQLPKHIISCDWGTSSFRLRLVDSETQHCIAEVTSENGNSSVFSKWKAQTETDRLHFYLRYLREAIDELSDKSTSPLSTVPILISGMASSTIGMLELPYADLPFAINGDTATAKWINAEPVLSNEILLISGAHSANDVMRGEEVQLVGVMSQIDFTGDNELLFLFPGTHCKHISVSDNEIVDFKTFMTGEIFDLVAKHSILSHAVSGIGPTEHLESFRKGVIKALRSELLNSLFSVRINQLKNTLTTEQNYFYLSGLLIGEEIKYIQLKNSTKVVLCSSGRLLKLYESALECLNLSQQVVIVQSTILDAAAAAGQIEIFKNYRVKN